MPRRPAIVGILDNGHSSFRDHGDRADLASLYLGQDRTGLIYFVECEHSRGLSPP
jgi:hypothetical protein